MSKTYKVELTIVVPDDVTETTVVAAVQRELSTIEVALLVVSIEIMEPKQPVPKKTVTEKLEIVDAFSLAFPEVCEMTLAVPTYGPGFSKPEGRPVFITIMRSAPGRWWIEGQKGARTTLVDALAEVLDIDDKPA